MNAERVKSSRVYNFFGDNAINEMNNALSFARLRSDIHFGNSKILCIGDYMVDRPPKKFCREHLEELQDNKYENAVVIYFADGSVVELVANYEDKRIDINLDVVGDFNQLEEYYKFSLSAVDY
jgi:hypothetical protein